jgi:hypothetical protein
MDGRRHVALCLFLVIILHGDPTLAGLCSLDLYLISSYSCWRIIVFLPILLFSCICSFSHKFSIRHLPFVWWIFYYDHQKKVYVIIIVYYWRVDVFLAETCRQYVKPHPFCFSAMCKANCAVEGKFSDGSYVKGYECQSSAFHSVCVCILCKN